MNEQENARLREVLKTIVLPKLHRDRDRRMSEEDTKIGLIDPVLEALGWKVRDWDEVQHEFRPKAGDNPVDYVLKISGKPWLLIEAKALGENLSDRKWLIQGLTYATAADVEWLVLSNGDEYRFYKATARGEAEEKRFCRVLLSEANEDDAVNALALLSHSNLDARLIEERATAYFVDGRVKAKLCELLSPPDDALVRLIHRRLLPQLSPNQIRDSLVRLHIHFDSAPTAPTLPPSSIVKKDDKLKLDETQQLLLEYWMAFKDVLERSNTVIKATKPQAGHSMTFAIGRSGFCLVATAGVQIRRIAAFLNIYEPDRSAHFHILEKDKDEIERELGPGFKLDWREMKEKKESHILWSREESDPTDRSKWPEQHALLLAKLDKLHRVFAPRIKNLTASDYTPEEKQ